MLASEYSEDISVQGWLMSEKLDGVRGYWTGTQMLTKGGHVLQVPPFFSLHFPPFALEGEIWGGRGTFTRTVSIIKSQQNTDGWKALQFAVFDVPEAAGGFVRRIQLAKEWFARRPSRFAFVIPQIPVQSKTEMLKELQMIEKKGGEGLIVRKPDAPYIKGRSKLILKVKSAFDAEAIVIGHRPGTGRNTGRLGALDVELVGNRAVRFRIGSGLTDRQRENPPAVGTVITFKYYGFYDSGIPRFPSFLRIRDDAGL